MRAQDSQNRNNFRLVRGGDVKRNGLARKQTYVDAI